MTDRPEAPPPWTPGARPPDQIALPGLTLRRWRASDAESIAEAVLASHDHLAPWFPWMAGFDLESARGYAARCEAEWLTYEAFDFGMRDPVTDAVLGSCGLMARIGTGGLEIGYWVRADQARRGLATAAAGALTAAAFALPGVERVEIHHDVTNVASSGVPRRLGYARVGDYEREPHAPGESGRLAVWVTPPPGLPAGQAPS